MKENKNRPLAPISFVIFLIVFGFLALSSAVRHSPTVDESVHLVSGYSYLKWGDYRANPEHPPLIKMWAALPLLWLDVKDPRPSSPTWDQIPKTEPGGPLYPFSTEMLFTWNDATTLFFFAKFQMLILSIVLAGFICVWSRELFGATAATIAVFLYGLDPNILAHSTIVHTDLPFAAVFFIGVYFYCRTLKEFTWYHLLLTSLLFGLAAITKHSVVVIVPVWLALSLAAALGREPQRYNLFGKVGTAATWTQRTALACALITSSAILGWVSIWAIYGLRFNAIPGEATPLFMTDVSSLQRPLAHAIQSIILDYRIFPEALVSGYLYNLKIWQHAAYLLGKVSENGFWSYFPVAFAVKTPLPTLILLVAFSSGLDNQAAVESLYLADRPAGCLFHSGHFVALQYRDPPPPACLSVSMRLDRRVRERALAGRLAKKEGWSSLPRALVSWGLTVFLPSLSFLLQRTCRRS